MIKEFIRRWWLSVTRPCQAEGCTKRGFWRRQGTAYHDDRLNWACLCKDHQEYADEYWQERWDEYYQGRMC